MKIRNNRFLIGLLIVGAGVMGAVTASTASNTIPQSHAGSITQVITPDALKPAACAGITVTNLVTGSGNTLAGTSANDLILANTGNDKLGSNASGQGQDCCVGGSGSDTYRNSCAVSVP